MILKEFLLKFKMLNNFLVNWFIIVLLVINYLLYSYNNKLYLFSLNIDRLMLLNGKVVHYITFKNVLSIRIKNWKSEKYFKVMLNVVLQHLSDVYGTVDNIYLSIVFFEFDPTTDLYNVISDACFVNLSKNVNVNDLYDLLKFNDLAFRNNNNNVVVIIKTI